MPVGAVIGASLGGAALSSSASRSASRTVADSTDRAADLQNQQFQQMLQLAMPGYNRANQAADVYMAALGLGGTQGQPSTQPPITSGGVQTQPGLMTGGLDQVLQARAKQRALMTGAETPQTLEAAAANYGPQATLGQPSPVQPSAAMTPQSVQEMVFNTPGYQAQLDQGLKAIDRASPLVGGMYSGRRMKALESHGQNTFGSYYGDWMNRVGGLAGQSSQIAQNVGQAGMQNASNVGNLMMTGANAQAEGRMNSANAWSSALGTGVGMYGASQKWWR